MKYNTYTLQEILQHPITYLEYYELYCIRIPMSLISNRKWNWFLKTHFVLLPPVMT